MPDIIDKIKPPLIHLRGLALHTYRRLAKPRVVRHCGVRLIIDRHLSPPIVDYIYRGYYEKSEIKAIRHSLEPDDVVMEIGTGIGFISLYCAKIIGGDRVYSFEANPALEGPIRRNFEVNRIFPRLEICILGDQDGEKDFYVERDFWVSSTIPKGRESRIVRVPVKPVNDVIRAIDPTFLILDIEGGEYELLRPLTDLHNIRKIAMELHEEVTGAEKIEFMKRSLIEAGFVIDPQFSRDRQLFARRSAVAARARAPLTTPAGPANPGA